jgi:hypothetical protein
LARAFGVPVSNLLILAFVLACPLMMISMIAGGQRGDGPDRRMNSTSPRKTTTCVRPAVSTADAHRPSENREVQRREGDAT